ncbi:hypothetical protein LCGC14_0967640 [marine sediment metagenome]|uniref:Uncharacterized protein n=1 Tax=marine sediment metagenome TaxID=412755 RepID=A0A0F9RJ21_9ZZZZ
MKIIKTAKYIEAFTLDKRTKQQIGSELRSQGLDGNGRFRESDEGVSIMWGILAKYGLVIEDVMSKDLFRGERGHRTFRIRKSAPSEDPFNPGEEVGNSMIVYTWQELMPGKFEILAYIS